MPFWLLQLVLMFATEILKEILEGTDWEAAKARFQEFARKAMPGKALDDTAAFIAGVCLDLIAAQLKKNPELTVRQAARIARQKLPMELARRNVAAAVALAAATKKKGK